MTSKNANPTPFNKNALGKIIEDKRPNLLFKKNVRITRSKRKNKIIK